MQSFDNFLNIPIAHRGLHNDKFVENSPSAFKAAIENGFGIETDVHLLQDGVVAVFHDDNIKRVCGKDVKIESLTSAQLKDYPMEGSGEIIPTLPELLKMVDGRVPVLIELKTLKGIVNNDLARAVLRDLKAYPYKDVIALQSFDPFAVKWLSKNQNEYPYGQLASMESHKGIPSFIDSFMGKLGCAKISRPMFIAYDIRFTPNKWIQAYLDKFFPVISWTVRTKEELQLAKDTTCNFIFENILPD